MLEINFGMLLKKSPFVYKTYILQFKIGEIYIVQLFFTMIYVCWKDDCYLVNFSGDDWMLGCSINDYLLAFYIAIFKSSS